MGCCSSQDDAGGGGGRGGQDFTDLHEVAEREKKQGGAPERQEQSKTGKQQQATMQKLSRYDTGNGNTTGPVANNERTVTITSPPISSAAAPSSNVRGGEVLPGAGLAALGTHGLPVQEAPVQLKAGPRSRIVETKLAADSSKQRQAALVSPPPQPPTSPPIPPPTTSASSSIKKTESNDALKEKKEPSPSNTRNQPTDDEAKMVAQLQNKLADLIANQSPDEDEESRNREALRKLKAEFKHEVQAPKTGFGGGLSNEEGEDEAPKGPPPNSPGVEGILRNLYTQPHTSTIEPIEEATVQSLDITASGDPTPVKKPTNEHQSNRYADHFPSANWFTEHNAKCPQVIWWQSKEQLWITIKVVDPEGVNCLMTSTTLLAFECQSNGDRYAVSFDLLESVSQEIECKVLKNEVQVCVTKVQPVVWPRRLIKGDRKRYMDLDWIDYDSAKSADDDESSDDDDINLDEK